MSLTDLTLSTLDDLAGNLIGIGVGGALLLFVLGVGAELQKKERLDADRIRKLAPRARADIVAALVNGAPKIAAAGITSPLRLQHFMA